MKNLSHYDTFQMEKYGNILPAYDNPLLQVNEEDENGAFDADEDERRFEQDEDNWHSEQEF
jgi:hypothetical protein